MSWPRFLAGLEQRIDGAFDGFERAVARAGVEVHGTELHCVAVHERAEPDAWSPAQVAEHVALANRYLLILADKIAVRSRARAARGELPPAEPPCLDALEQIAARDFHWAAPAHMVPSELPDLARALGEIAAQHARCRAWLREFERGEGRLHAIRMRIAADERLDLYQFLAFVALHLERHARQVARLQARVPGSASFPAERAAATPPEAPRGPSAGPAAGSAAGSAAGDQ